MDPQPPFPCCCVWAMSLLWLATHEAFDRGEAKAQKSTSQNSDGKKKGLTEKNFFCFFSSSNLKTLMGENVESTLRTRTSALPHTPLGK